VRYAVERMNEAIAAISRTSFTHTTSGSERIAGRLRASLAFAQITDIMAGGLSRYLNSVIEQCKSLHAAVHEVYIDYPIQSASGGLMFYAIRHFTRFPYSRPFGRRDGIAHAAAQRAHAAMLHVSIVVSPQARVFRVPGSCGQFSSTTSTFRSASAIDDYRRRTGDVETPAPLPETLGPDAWDELDAMIESRGLLGHD